MNIGTEYAVSYGYDNKGRFNKVTSGSDTFTYTYQQNSHAINSMSISNGLSVSNSRSVNPQSSESHQLY